MLKNAIQPYLISLKFCCKTFKYIFVIFKNVDNQEDKQTVYTKLIAD